MNFRDSNVDETVTRGEARLTIVVGHVRTRTHRSVLHEKSKPVAEGRTDRLTD